MKDAIVPIHFRPRDVILASPIRKSFSAVVVGASNCGKTSFIKAFIESQNQSHEDRQFNCIKAIREKDPKKKD